VNLKNLTWQQVAVILGAAFMIMAAVIVLTIYGKDTAGVLTFGGVLLAGLGFGAVASGQTAIKENVNGNTTKLLQIVEAQGKMLASMAPPTQDGEVVEEQLVPSEQGPLSRRLSSRP